MSKVETQEVDVEVVTDLALNKEFEGIIALAGRLDAIADAKDKIRSFILKRALPGDWVRFGDRLELGGPGSERVASDLGVSFRNWRDWKESGEDENGKWYTWWYQADAECQGRILEKVEGRASSRDKFFGYDNGAWKQLADVNEANIRTAARRCVMKEGTKLMFGIRGIPFEDAARLGLDIKKVKTVTFGSNSGGGGAGKPKGEKHEFVSKVVNVQQKTVGNDKKVFVVSFDNDKYKTAETFSKTLAETAKNLKDRWATVGIEENGRFAPKLKSLIEAPAPKDKENKDDA